MSSAYALQIRDTLHSQDLGCLRVSVFLKVWAAMFSYPLTSLAMSLEIFVVYVVVLLQFVLGQ